MTKVLGIQTKCGPSFPTLDVGAHVYATQFTPSNKIAQLKVETVPDVLQIQTLNSKMNTNETKWTSALRTKEAELVKVVQVSNVMKTLFLSC